MSHAAQILLDQVLALSDAEQEEVLTGLILNLEGPLPSPEEQATIDADWAAEIKRRVASYRDGTAKLIDADEVFANLRREFPR